MDINSIQIESTDAQKFHDVAGHFLLSLGFELTNNPNNVVNVYQQNAATYRTDNGFYLSIWFDPYDGNCAGISCGREWTTKDGNVFAHSNNYSSLAKKFDIKLQEYYQLSEGVSVVIKKIIADLKSSISLVLSNTTLADLLEIENEEYGSLRKAMNYLGRDYKEQVEISKYPIEE